MILSTDLKAFSLSVPASETLSRDDFAHPILENRVESPKGGWDNEEVDNPLEAW